MLRKLGPIGLVLIRQAMVYPARGEETKPDVVQNSENLRPCQVEGLIDLSGGRIRLFLEKSKNCITKIVLKGLSWPLVTFDSLPASSKSRCPLLDSQEAHCILMITLFKLGDDL
jgi:hypothetical protein